MSTKSTEFHLRRKLITKTCIPGQHHEGEPFLFLLVNQSSQDYGHN